MADNKKDKIQFPVCDMGRALNLADRFNIASGSRRGLRTERILSDALSFMNKTILPEIAEKSAIEVACVHFSDPFLDVAEGQKIAREKDNIADLAGHAAVKLSKTSLSIVKDIRKAFDLSSNTQAAVLAVRVYGKALDNIWRGNSLVSASRQERLDTDYLMQIVRPAQP